MSRAARTTAAAAVAVALTSSSLLPVFAGPGWLPRVTGAVAVVAIAASGARRAGLPAPLSPLAGLAGLLLYAAVLFAGSTFSYGVLPTGGTLTALHELWTTGRTDVRSYGPPVPVTPGLALLCVLGVGAVAVATDALAVVAAKPAAAGLPLLLLLAVPSAVLHGDVGWVPFVLGAAGWLGMLLVEGGDRLAGWGTPLAPGGAADEVDPARGRVGRRIGAAALGLAVVVPAAVPGLSDRLFQDSSGNGAGGSGGGGSATTFNPITTLRGQLEQPHPKVLLSYTSTDPAPDYLRLTTLNLFDGITWSSSPLQGRLPDDAVANGVPPAEGQDSGSGGSRARSAVPGREVLDHVTIRSLRAPWLPVPFVTSAVDVNGPWLFDPASQTVFATRTDTLGTGPYDVRARRLEPDPARLRTAGSSSLAVDAYTSPVVVSDAVRSRTQEIVRGLTRPYDQALAVQAWFRDPANGFRYDLRTVDGPADPLTDFLANRVGFCEQYASAMAAMLRVLGLPSRVGVGFTPGEHQADGSWVVRTSDAHAWPEAWFAGAGWVRFEPTPASGGRITPPDYSLAPTSPQLGGGRTGNSRLPTPRASTGAGRIHGPIPDDSGPVGAVPTALPVAHGRSLRLPLLGLAVLLLALAPSLLAVARRHTRARRMDPSTAWRQLRDDARDVGFGWAPNESPRAGAARLRAERQLADDAALALGRVVGLVERERYARPAAAAAARAAGDGGGSPGDARSGAGGGPLAAEVATVRAALLAGAPTATRWRARLLPPSTLRWAGSAVAGRVADLLDRFDDLLAAVGRRMHLSRSA